MIRCKDVVDLAFDYINGEMDPERKDRLEDHLRRCPSCINFLNTYRAVPDLSRELLKSKMPPLLKDVLKEYLRAELVGRKGEPDC